MKALVRILPGFLVKFFARPYVAGDSLDKGLMATRQLLERGLLTTFDLLSENVESRGQVDAVCRVYREMVEACAGFPDPETRPSISLKPSSFTTSPLDQGDGASAEGSAEAIGELAELSRHKGVRLSIDMEDHHWTDWTLDFVRELHARGHDHVGAVLQTRLHRTMADLDRLPPGARVRLVIGIYLESPELATTDKREMKERMLQAAGILLERGYYVEFGTHDEAVIERFLTETVPESGAGPDRYEIQMLFGVPRESLQRKLREGALGSGGAVRTRIYVPFATSWRHAIAYCRRRLLENPSIVTMGLRNLARGLSGRR
ncbi:MAG: proline dehydrogenase family protein [Planctomycetota bacterium]